MEFQNEIKKNYKENKESLRLTFMEAAEFLDYLENAESKGFHVGTDKNLHMYFKDDFLFYFNILNGTTIEISRKFNSKIKVGTKSNADSFIHLLIYALEQSNKFKRPLENLKKNKIKIAISQSTDSALFFNAAKKALNLIAHQKSR